jgi:hypothetical protein
MSRLIEHIEKVRMRLTEISSSELQLVRALGDALSRVDEKLLRDVRAVTAEHEARRGEILCELQLLAVRVGTFPTPPETFAEIGADASHGDGTNGHHHAAIGVGDWRQAAKNIEDDLDFLDWELGREVRAAANGHHNGHQNGYSNGSRDIRVDQP